jgi:hypothetical protein
LNPAPRSRSPSPATAPAPGRWRPAPRCLRLHQPRPHPPALVQRRLCCPALGTFGNLGRNVVRAPGFANWDVSFSKKAELFRTANDHPVQLQFRGEFFNLFNHTQWSGVSAAVGAANFGQITSARDPRLTQLGLRLIF